jgi:hypothetical protein
MHPTLSPLLARSRERELIEQGARARLGAAKAERPTGPIAVRLATADDQPALDRLTALDSREPLVAPALIGELDNYAVAAISLNNGDLIADPFVPTIEIAQLLRLRAHQLVGQPRPRRRLWRPARLLTTADQRA